jgi:hypothetical protein
MTNSLPKLLRANYRQEPISSFLFLIGATDAAIGGLGERWGLFYVGLMVVSTAALVRWLQTRKYDRVPLETPTRYYLPSSSSRPPLPLLTKERNL